MKDFTEIIRLHRADTTAPPATMAECIAFGEETSALLADFVEQYATPANASRWFRAEVARETLAKTDDRAPAYLMPVYVKEDMLYLVSSRGHLYGTRGRVTSDLLYFPGLYDRTVVHVFDHFPCGNDEYLDIPATNARLETSNILYACVIFRYGITNKEMCEEYMRPLAQSNQTPSQKIIENMLLNAEKVNDTVKRIIAAPFTVVN